MDNKEIGVPCPSPTAPSGLAEIIFLCAIGKIMYVKDFIQNIVLPEGWIQVRGLSPALKVAISLWRIERCLNPEKKIPQIAHIRNISGSDLLDSKRAWERVYEMDADEAARFFTLAFYS